MTIDPRLLELLICPNCHGEIEYLEADQKIVCRGECRYEYPVREGIPVMLIDEAKKPQA